MAGNNGSRVLMLIALDYDKTFTADRYFWNKFCVLARNSLHDVVCFTMRYPNEIIVDMPTFVKIYYTSRKAKKVWAEQNGILVDIWIDDNPAWLFEDAL